MAYKIKPKKQKEFPPEYFEKLEVKELNEKYKGHLPPATELSRVGTRNTLHIGTLTHRKNHLVHYKGNIVKIKKVEKKGIYVQTFHRDKEDFLVPNKKLTFIPEHRIEHEIYPIALPQIPIGSIAPYDLATLDF
jgi:hypothetical protein